VINVDNWDAEMEEHGIKDGQLFYQSSVSFKDKFTSLIGKHLQQTRNSKTSSINVKINFKILKRNDNYKKKQQLCDKTFAYLGLQDTIYI
jgi:hypothetical protein